MEENAINVAEVATETAVVSAKSGKKSGLVIGAVTVATLAVAFGTYKLVARIRNRKAAKKAVEVAE